MSANPSTRVMLWRLPRTRGTVFEMSMASVPSFKIFHNPYTIAYLWGEDRSVVLAKESAIPGYKYAEEVEELESDYPGKTAVFGKDIPHFLNGNMDYLPVGYLHTFLIRDPKKSCLSYYKVFKAGISEKLEDDVREKYLSYMINMKPLWDLYCHVTGALQQKPIIIESDDLVTSPREVLQKYCSETGLPFHESMLNWKPGNTGHWPQKVLDLQSRSGVYNAALTSTCFLPPTKEPGATSYTDEPELPEEIWKIIESNQAIYHDMYQRKITI
ncbi:uncharacterized protein LOC144444989 [Glandiceps talaboti]